MTPEMAGTTVIIISLIITIILVFAQCKSAKKEFKWHSDMLIGFKDDEIKALKEKISRLESEIAVKDTIISELGRLNNQNTEKLWNMNGLLLNKATNDKDKIKAMKVCNRRCDRE